MCVIIHNKPSSRILTKEEFTQSFNRNPHGFGLMYSKDEEIVVEKSLDLTESYKMYQKAYADCKGGNLVTHFRMATHGSIKLDNCHPFPCGLDSSGGQMYLAHNGVLGFTSQANPDWSDTKIYAHMLSKFPRGWIEIEEYRTFANKQLSWDKVLIMDSHGNVYYLGAKGVDVDDGIWASNSGPIVYKKSSLGSFLRNRDDDNADNEEEEVCGVIKKKRLRILSKPKEGTFIKVPQESDETDDFYFYDGILYGNDFLINRQGYVEYYIEN